MKYKIYWVSGMPGANNWRVKHPNGEIMSYWPTWEMAMKFADQAITRGRNQTLHYFYETMPWGITDER